MQVRKSELDTIIAFLNHISSKEEYDVFLGSYGNLLLEDACLSIMQILKRKKADNKRESEYIANKRKENPKYGR